MPEIGGPSPPPPPICRGSGVHPHPHPRILRGLGSTPDPRQIGGSVPCLLLWPGDLGVPSLEAESATGPQAAPAPLRLTGRVPMSETAVAWRPRQPECQWARGFRRHSRSGSAAGDGLRDRIPASLLRMIPTDFESPAHPQPAAAALARGVGCVHSESICTLKSRPQALGTLPRGCAAGRRSPLRSHRRARQPAIDRRAAPSGTTASAGPPSRVVPGGGDERALRVGADRVEPHLPRPSQTWRLSACHQSVPCDVDGCLCSIV